MTIRFINQSATGSNFPGGTNTTLGISIPAPAVGNLLICAIHAADDGGGNNTTITGVSGGTGASWAQRAMYQFNLAGEDIEMWSSPVQIANTSITVTGSSSTNSIIFAGTVLEISGLSTVLDGTPVTNSGSSTSDATGSFSTTNAADFVLAHTGFFGNPSVGSAGAPWTDLTGITGVNTATGDNITWAGAYQIVATTGTFSATWALGASATWANIIAAISASLAVDEGEVWLRSQMPSLAFYQAGG